jgi:hypothetical protein
MHWFPISLGTLFLADAALTIWIPTYRTGI